MHSKYPSGSYSLKSINPIGSIAGAICRVLSYRVGPVNWGNVSEAIMNCKEATKSYEAWLARHTQIVKSDLRLKHKQMSADVFSFMRATFYRWLELWAKGCRDL